MTPEAEERQRRLEDDRRRHEQGAVDDERDDEVREHVDGHDPQPAGAERAGGLDELTLAQRDHLAAHDPGDRAPGEQDDHDDRDSEPGTDERHEGDGEQQERQAQRGVDQPRQDSVDPAAEEAGGEPDGGADTDGDDRRHGADDDRDAGAVRQTDEQVTTELIGTEPELGARPDRKAELGEPGVAVLLVDRVTGPPGDQRGGKGEQHHQADDDRRHDRPAVAPQPGERQLRRTSGRRSARWRSRRSMASRSGSSSGIIGAAPPESASGCRQAVR